MNAKAETDLFKSYVADALFLYFGKGKAFTVSYSEIMKPKTVEEEDAMEIIRRTIQKCGLKVIGGNNDLI